MVSDCKEWMAHSRVPYLDAGRCWLLAEKAWQAADEIEGKVVSGGDVFSTLDRDLELEKSRVTDHRAK